MGQKLANAAKETKKELEEAEEERKKVAKEKINKLVDELDTNLEKDSLLNQLRLRDEELAARLADEEDL